MSHGPRQPWPEIILKMAFSRHGLVNIVPWVHRATFDYQCLFPPRQACLEAGREEVAEDGVEDHSLVVVGHVDVPDYVEVPHESRCNMSSATQGATRDVGYAVEVLRRVEIGMGMGAGRDVDHANKHEGASQTILTARRSFSDGKNSSPATTWRTHGANHGDIDYLSVGQLLAIVPAVLVKPLPQDLDWRLGTILLPVMVGCKAE